MVARNAMVLCESNTKSLAAKTAQNAAHKSKNRRTSVVARHKYYEVTNVLFVGPANEYAARWQGG